MMTNNNNEEDRRWGRTSLSPALPPAPPIQNAKTQHLLRRRRRVPARDVQQHEPWLFHSTNMGPLPVLPTPLSTLSPSTSDSSFFYLDLASLKSLLPSRESRHRPRTSEDEYNSYRGARKPPSRGRHAPPARLEALNLSTTHSGDKKHRHRKRRRQMGLTSKQKLRRKALRIDSAKVRPSTQELLDSDTAAVYLSPTKRVRNKARKNHRRGHSRETKRRPAKRYAFDYDSDNQDEMEKPATPLEDLDEEKRQKVLIATHLNLTLEEYENLDAAFGKNAQPSFVSEDERTMTERYYDEFREFDVDNSGAISPDELRQLLLASGEDMDEAELASVLQQADTDHDGEINFSEFIALMRARKRLLQVANQMGLNGNGPTNTVSPGLHFTNMSSPGQVLPPLKIAARPVKRHQNKALVAGRATPTCLRPGSKVDIGELRRELALSEYGIQELNSKVREGLQWVQQHCPVRSLKAQVFCHRWGMEKVHQLFLRLQSQQMSRAFRKWNAFLVFERNKVKANMFLKCKGSQKLMAIMNKWRRRVTRRKFAQWKTECIREARNELHSAAIEIQRVVRGDLARLLRLRIQEEIAVVHIQALIRGRVARNVASQLRQAKLENEAASLLQHCYRGYTGKRLARALFKAQRETLAACHIQRAFRNFQRRELLRVIQQTKLENDSVIVIQCSIRRYLAQQERTRRATRLLRERSAVILQRYMRGYHARCRVLKIKEQIRAALAIQCFFRACQSRRRVHMLRTEKQTKERQAIERTSAITIQARWRCAITRKHYLFDKQRRAEAQKLERFRRLTSAVAIQSLFRGYIARRSAQRARYEKLKWMNLTLLNRSALKIQAFWRGYHGRLASHLRLQAQKAHQHQENEAAKRIQVIARGKRARDERRRLDQERAKLASQQRVRVRAALRIQKVFRGKQARKMVQELQWKHHEEARIALERLVHQTKTRAATKIQCCSRRFLARCRYFYRKREMEDRKVKEELRITQNQAAIVIQCAIRRAGARRILLQRRREFEKRISMMASEKAHDEIEMLRQEQEEELLKLKMQLIFQANNANEEAEKLREELARQREEEEIRRKEEAQELARLRLETLMQQQEIDTRIEQDKQKKLEAQRLRERLEAEKQTQQEKEAAMRSQENEELAAMKLASMLQSRPSTHQEDKEDRTLQQEAEHLKQAALAIHMDQARMKIQAVCLKHIARKRLAKLEKNQAAAMANIHDEEQRLRLKAEQQKELALAKLKNMMDDEARAREQEIKELEVQMLERAQKEKERIAVRNTSARKIQSCARGYLARQRVKAIQLKIEKEREDRAKAIQETIEAAEAEVAEALIEAGETETDAAEGSEETKPDEWVEYWDENAQASYFYNIRTQEASWTRPVATPSAKAMEIVMAATGLTEGREQGAADGYVDYAVTGQVDENGYPVESAAAENYADEYGYYDQYGQYHYYDQNNAAYYGDSAYGQGYPQMMGVQPDYTAAAAANYAYQAAAAMAYNQAMMYGAPMMAYGNQAMIVQPVQQYPQTAAPEVTSDAAPTTTEDAGEAVPADPWEKFYDQYTGAAYYYNNITGEQYWA